MAVRWLQRQEHLLKMIACVTYPQRLCICPANEVKAPRLDTYWLLSGFPDPFSSPVWNVHQILQRSGIWSHEYGFYAHIPPSAMQASPPNLSQDDRSIVFDLLDLRLNRMILEALLYGMTVPYSRSVSVKHSLWRSIHRHCSDYFMGDVYVNC